MNKKTSCYHNRSIVVIFIDKKRTGMDDGLDEGHDRLLQRSCLILGTSLLFPFYCFVTAVDFWNSQFPESWDFMFLVGVCHNVPNFLLLIFQIVYLRQVLTCDIRIIVSIGIYFACLLCVPIFIIAKLSAGTMFTVCLIVLCFVGGAASILQGTLFSVIAQLGPRYVRMLFVGNAGAGVVTGILRVLTKFALEKHHEAQALLFFAVAALFTALAACNVVDYFAGSLDGAAGGILQLLPDIELVSWTNWKNQGDIGDKTPKQAARQALYAIILRIPIFVPVFYYLGQRSPGLPSGPLNNSLAFVAVFGMAFSNGMLASKCMVLSPMLVGELGNVAKEYSGLLMSFGLTAGIMGGSLSGLLWTLSDTPSDRTYAILAFP
eukprot:GEMP01046717.1.p1 GENE.GEMP01046717.1~~GEMP01046717.1.p1  ORF type:complete len:377 (+),score=40.58 GEMP01046717.1:135-1265(+)